MFPRATSLALTSLLFLHTAQAQDPGAAPATTPVPPAVVLESVRVSAPSDDGRTVDIQQPPGAQQLAVVRQAYDEARKKLGGEHVLLTAMAYVGKERSSGRWGKTQGGVAGVISVPLFGAGNGHGGDWYPVLQTEDSTQAFARFQQELKLYSEALDSAANAELSAPVALRVLKDAANTLLDQVSEDDPSTWEFAHSVRACIQTLNDPSAQIDLAAVQDETQGKLIDRPIYALRGSTIEAVKVGVEKLSAQCQTVLKEVVGKRGSEAIESEAQAIVAMLKLYWQKLPVDQQLPKRHWLLLGPALGIPITQDPTDLVLVGGYAELGANRYFRLGLTGGAQFRYANLEQTPGWFAGLALTGALGDELIHWINGGLSAARKLQALP